MTARASAAAVRTVAEDDPIERLDEAMELIDFAFRRIVEAPDRELARRGMGRLHHRLLYVIGHNPGIDVRQTGELLGISKQAVHGPLRDLVEEDLVEVERPSSDRRRKLLTLTVAGKAFERRLAEMQHAVFAEAFERAGPRAVEAWCQVMDALGAGRRLRV